MRNWFPGYASSNRINKENSVPMTPAKAPKVKYNVPMSLWLVEKNHRLTKPFMELLGSKNFIKMDANER
jgi:hypothetical protein